MLNYSLQNDPEFLPFLTLGFFCGVRPDGELQKLYWTDVRLDGEPPQVVVRPEVSKSKRRRRFIDLNPNAVAWIEAYLRSGHPLSGKVVPFSASTLKRKRNDLCRATGVTWIQQGMRHTYCSNWLAMHGDINKLVLQSGHTDTQTMWEHYHRGTTKGEAEKFWNIHPSASDSKIVPFQTVGTTAS
jgi:integrase